MINKTKRQQKEFDLKYDKYLHYKKQLDTLNQNTNYYVKLLKNSKQNITSVQVKHLRNKVNHGENYKRFLESKLKIMIF